MPKHYGQIAIDVEHELYDLTDTEKRELIEKIISILEIRGDIKSIKKLETIKNKIAKYTEVKIPWPICIDNYIDHFYLERVGTNLA